MRGHGRLVVFLSLLLCSAEIGLATDALLEVSSGDASKLATVEP